MPSSRMIYVGGRKALGVDGPPGLLEVAETIPRHLQLEKGR